MSALVTEHFVLQSAASTTTSESGSRASVYLATLSSGLVALGFTSGKHSTFLAFAGALLPTVIILGLFTIVRLVDTSVENTNAIRRIDRISAFYLRLAPDAEDLFGDAAPTIASASSVRGVRYSSWSLLFSLASLVAAVSAALVGASIALLLAIASALMTAGAVAVGVAAGLATFAAALAYQRMRFGDLLTIQK